MSTQIVKVVVHENRPLVRVAILSILEKRKNTEVVDTTANEKRFLESVRDNQPGVIIFNPKAWTRDPITVLQELEEICPRAKLLALLDVDQRVLMYNFRQRGIPGCLLETDRMVLSIDQAVDAIVDDGRAYSFDFTEEALDHQDVHIDEIAWEMLALVAQGLSNQMIADRLGVTEPTVRNTISRAYDKMGISKVPGMNRRVIAAQMVVKLGFV